MSSREHLTTDDKSEEVIFEDEVQHFVNYFKRLPVEVVENIFIFLDPYSLMSWSLVDKKFNDVIRNSREVMRQFVLHIHGSKNLEEIATFRRRYQKIKFLHTNLDKIQEAIAAMQEIGCEGTEIEIVNCSLYVSSQLLPCFSNVVRLETYENRINVLSPTMFPNLKHLKLQQPRDVRVAPGIWNLETLDVVCKISNINQVCQLLENQRSLDTLRLKFICYGDQNFQLNLHSELKIRRLFAKNYSDSLQAFNMILQLGGKVECLKYFTACSEENLLKILEHFSTVKALTLRNLPKVKSFYGFATVNTELTELVVDEAMSCKAMLEVFTIFPSLKKLSIYLFRLKICELTQEELIQLRGNLNRLERFTVALGAERELVAMKQLAPKITNLYIKLSNPPMTYKSLKVVCKNVTFLSIGDWIGDLTACLMLSKVLECFPQLKTLQLSEKKFEFFKSDLWSAIKDKARNLQSLKLQNAKKDVIRSLYREARLFGIKRLFITSIDDACDFDFFNMCDSEPNYLGYFY